MYVLSVLGIQKRGSEALELEFQAVVSYHMDTGKQISSSARATRALNNEPSLQPQHSSVILQCLDLGAGLPEWLRWTGLVRTL